MIGKRPGWIFPTEDSFRPFDQLRDFRNYLYLVFREHGLGVPTLRQYELAHFLQHGEERIEGDLKLLVEGYRGMGKSTIACIFCTWLLFWWRDRHTIVISASEPKAIANCTFMRELFDSVELLRPLAPRAGQRDSGLAFDIAGAVPSLDTSVKAIGVMGQMTGFHGDVLLFDDVEIPNNSETPGAREKLAVRTQELGALGNPNSLKIGLGTPQSEDTIYLKFRARGYRLRKWPSEYPDRARLAAYGDELAPTLRREVEAEPQLAGHPTDPERYDGAVLEGKRLEYGAAGYALQFLLDTSLTDAERFPLRLADLVVMDVSTDVAPEHVVWASSTDLIRTDIPCLGRDGDRFHSPMQLVGEWLPYTGSVLAVDPSGRGRDEAAWAVVKLLNGQLFLVDFGAEMDGFEALPRIAQKAAQHKVNLVRTEDYGGGSYAKLLGDALQQAGHPCAIEEVTQRQRKERRLVRTLEPVISRHKLIVDAGALRRDVETAKSRGGETWIYYSLAHQLTRLADEADCLVHDDRIDAVAIGVDHFSALVELSPDRYIERHKEEERARHLRERAARLSKLDPARLEPNGIRSTNRGLSVLRGVQGFGARRGPNSLR